MTAVEPVERLDPQARWLPPWVRAQHIRRYAWAAGYVRGAFVLDIACGTGYGAAMLAEAGASRVVGADLDTSAVALAAARVSDQRCEFAVADATATDYADGAFDCVVSFETIEHIDDDLAFLAEMYRVLKPGGLFLCSTPNREVMNPATTIHDGSFNPHHVREYSASEFAERLRCYFVDVEMYGQSLYSSAYVRLLTAVARAHRLAAVRMHQARKLVTAPFVASSDHRVRPADPGYLYEVFVAVCRRP